MPFKPRIVTSDDAEHESNSWELPADLQALADQLSDDAAHLCQQFPADAPALWAGTLKTDTTPVPESVETAKKLTAARKLQVDNSTRRARSWIRWGSLASSLLVVGTLAIAMRGGAWNTDEFAGGARSSSLHTTAADTTRATLPSSGRVAAATADPLAGIPGVTQYAPFQPATTSVVHRLPTILQHVSEPELEGWLDLMEQQPKNMVSVSF